jgi:hypothetical protein
VSEVRRSSETAQKIALKTSEKNSKLDQTTSKNSEILHTPCLAYLEAIPRDQVKKIESCLGN